MRKKNKQKKLSRPFGGSNLTADRAFPSVAFLSHTKPTRDKKEGLKEKENSENTV